MLYGLYGKKLTESARTSDDKLSIVTTIWRDIMNKTIVIYQSKYGSTKKYANWLAEALQCEAIERKQFKVKQFNSYDTIIFGGCVYVSDIKGLSLLQNNAESLKGKRVICFAVGAAPADEAVIDNLRQKNMTGSLKDLKLFYFRGAIDRQKFKGFDKLMMDMFYKMASKKDPAALESSEAAFLDNLSNGADWTDKNNLIPLINYIRG